MVMIQTHLENKAADALDCQTVVLSLPEVLLAKPTLISTQFSLLTFWFLTCINKRGDLFSFLFFNLNISVT